MNTAAQRLVSQHLVTSNWKEIVRISVSECEPDAGPHQDHKAPQGESSYMHPQDKLAKSTKGHLRRALQDTLAMSGSAGYRMYVLTLTGRGFTWMDVRRVVSALLSVGKIEDEGKRKLLSVEAILR